MQDFLLDSEFETALAGERPRLVRLCAWFTGSHESAEDLAQETMIAAWKNRDQLASLDKLKPWTSAIARNICLNWARTASREQAYCPRSIEDPDERLENELADGTDLELELDRNDLASLLDRALSLLPTDTGQMLIEHYLNESSHADIAAVMKLKPGTVAVRLQRGKLSLQRLLQTDLKEEALAFGLVQPQDSEWVETNIWCLCCGQKHLLGKLQQNQIFALRCPQCSPEPGSIMVGMDLTQPYYANVLGGTRAFKPAYSRLLAALAPVYRQALQSDTSPCPACGESIIVNVDREMGPGDASHIMLHCPNCGWASNKTLSGLVMAMPESQKFWREYPRITIQSGQEIEIQGSPAFPTTIKSVTGSAELTVISKRDTFEVMAVHSNVPL